MNSPATVDCVWAQRRRAEAQGIVEPGEGARGESKLGDGTGARGLVPPLFCRLLLQQQTHMHAKIPPAFQEDAQIGHPAKPDARTIASWFWKLTRRQHFIEGIGSSSRRLFIQGLPLNHVDHKLKNQESQWENLLTDGPFRNLELGQRRSSDFSLMGA